MANTTPGLLPGFETTFITRSELSDEGLKAIQERLNGVVAQFGGELIHQEDWGKRKLAYPIAKESRGHYTYFVYTGKGDVVHEIERNLRLNDQVLRFLSVNLEKEFNGEAFKKARVEQQAAAKRREEEREARREERMSAMGGERRGYSPRQSGDQSESAGYQE
ncbi:MAG: 30S ribosomal protein S6 [Oligoflexia bacterium]